MEEIKIFIITLSPSILLEFFQLPETQGFIPHCFSIASFFKKKKRAQKTALFSSLKEADVIILEWGVPEEIWRMKSEEIFKISQKEKKEIVIIVPQEMEKCLPRKIQKEKTLIFKEVVSLVIDDWWKKLILKKQASKGRLGKNIKEKISLLNRRKLQVEKKIGACLKEKIETLRRKEKIVKEKFQQQIFEFQIEKLKRKFVELKKKKETKLRVLLAVEPQLEILELLVNNLKEKVTLQIFVPQFYKNKNWQRELEGVDVVIYNKDLKKWNFLKIEKLKEIEVIPISFKEIDFKIEKDLNSYPILLNSPIRFKKFFECF